MIPYIKDSTFSTRKVDKALAYAEKNIFSSKSICVQDLKIKDSHIHIHDEEFQITKGGIHNLCNTYRIPDPFASRIPTDLFTYNINRLSQECGTQLMDVYFEDRKIIDINKREDYTAIQNRDFITSLINNQLSFEESRFMFENHRLKIEVASTGIEISDINEVHKIGYMLNHYPTNRSLTLGNFMVWTVACTNGALLPNVFGRHKLINKNGKDIKRLLSRFFHNLIEFPINQKTIIDAINNLKKNSFNYKESWEQYRKIKKLIGFEDAIKCMGEGYSESLIDKIRDNYKDTPDELLNSHKYETYYGMTNFGSITTNSLNISKKLQSMAGKLLLSEVSNLKSIS